MSSPNTSRLPAEFGAEPDYQAAHGGMTVVKVPENGPAGKAGFKSGDVLVAYGGRKIDNCIDYASVVHSYSEDEKVVVTAMRGPVMPDTFCSFRCGPVIELPANAGRLDYWKSARDSPRIYQIVYCYCDWGWQRASCGLV